MIKAELRQSVKGKIDAIPPDERMRATQLILQLTRSFLRTVDAVVAAFYMPLPDEVDIVPLIRWWQERGLLVALPRTIPKERKLEFRLVASLNEDLQVGAFGIMEPKQSCPLVMPEEIGIIVVPGRVFDECGNRIGRGLGYYDRFLKTLPSKVLKLALAFECQLVPRIPVKPDDVPMDVIITERRTIIR